jgi:hypothetical protein
MNLGRDNIGKLRSLIGITKNKLFYSKYKTLLEEQPLFEYHDRHYKKRCFLIGTGPSINSQDLSVLKDEISMGVNCLYKSGIKTTYHIVVGRDPFNVIPTNEGTEKFYQELRTIGSSRTFLGGSMGRWFLKNKIFGGSIVIKEIGELDIWNNFNHDIVKKGIRGGRNVICSALQLLYYMGFSEVYLLGCDFDYTKGHSYDNEGNNSCDWKRVQSSLSVINRIYEDNNRHIYNCTPNSKLEVFKRKNLDEVLCHVK